MREQFICHADTSIEGNVFHKNATIYESPNGDLLAAWFAGDVGEGNRDQNSYGARRPAGEEEWGDDELLVGIDNRAVGCPIYFEGPGGDLWLTAPVMYGDWLTKSKVFYKRSPDGGATWGDLELLTEQTGIYLKNKPIHLEEENRWILPAYSAVEDKPYFFLIPGDQHVRPADYPPMVGGDQVVRHNEEGYMGSLGMTHPSVVELDDSTLMAYLRPRQDGHLYETRSYDRGLNWETAEQTSIPNPNAAFDMVHTEDGNIVLINNPVPEHNIPEGRNKLALFMSEDEGETWPYQMWLEREETDQPLSGMSDGERPEFTYGNVIQGRDGTIHLAYEFRRRGIKHVEITEEEIRNEAEEDPIVEDMV